MKRTALNKLLLLRVIKLAKNLTSFRKIAQLVFILQEEGRQEKRVTFNYEFRKWHYEPYSVELEKDIQQLHRENLIEKANETISLTKKGNYLADKASEYYRQEKVDLFFKFFIYIHVNETLYETSDSIHENYSIGSYETDSVISPLSLEDDTLIKPSSTEKKKISQVFKDLDDEDYEQLIRARKLLSFDT
ncbi:hypothetical protein CN918_32145 [Priestia megaterium]|nr:hypothetical protein CN918_32145 [Priestia megaterium]